MFPKLTLLTILAISLTICLARYEIDMNESMLKLREQCLNSTSLSHSEIAKGNVDFSKIPPESHLCYAKCIKEKLGILNADGTINLDNFRNSELLKWMDQNMQSQLVECMRQIPGIRECSDMLKVRKCFSILRN